MTQYLELVRNVASAHAEEIEADLRLARQELDRARADIRAKEARVQALQGLVELVSTGGRDAGDREARVTLHDAMAEVLYNAPEKMMRAGDLAAEIQRRDLYRMRDGRPVEPQQIHARVGHYPDRFEKVGTFIKLKD